MTSGDPDELSARRQDIGRRQADNSEVAAGGDPLGVIAIVVGCIGIVVLGIVLCPVTAWLAAIAGGRARDAGRSQENAYLGFALAALDGIVWLVLHFVFDLKFIAG